MLSELQSYRQQKNIVLHAYEAIYFYIPKVACSSLKTFCALLLDMPFDRPKNDMPYTNIHKKDYPFVERSKILLEYTNYFKFAIVRNPYDRLVSCYKNKISHKKSIMNLK